MKWLLYFAFWVNSFSGEGRREGDLQQRSFMLSTTQWHTALVTFAICGPMYKGIQDSLGFWVRGFHVLDSNLCHWNVDSVFQSLVGFKSIPWAVFRIRLRPRILDSKSKIFPDFGFHKQNLSDSRTWGDICITLSCRDLVQRKVKFFNTVWFPLSIVL